jgi:hypothetical protein
MLNSNPAPTHALSNFQCLDKGLELQDNFISKSSSRMVSKLSNMLEYSQDILHIAGKDSKANMQKTIGQIITSTNISNRRRQLLSYFGNTERQKIFRIYVHI